MRSAAIKHVGPVTMVAAVASLLLSCPEYAVILGRLVRNPFCSKSPRALMPIYRHCSPKFLVEQITLVVTVKDTCSQATRFLSHTSEKIPRDVAVIYVYPEFVGCRSVDPNTKLFSKLTIVKTPHTASPIQGFLNVQRLITTPYALLTHNDAYLMDSHALCELVRALQEHPEAEFAAPQLYERSENDIAVPHGHHKNLHLTQSFSGRYGINYDIDFNLLTQRCLKDFVHGGYPQTDFMEDHMYMARTGTYHKYLDPMASFTMEYIDSILAMRLNHTYPWYVPTARVIFDVDVRKIGWRDIPYFVHKRSEEIGLRVRAYLSHKWDVDFPNTGIWNYVRYSFLSNTVYDDNALPTGWDDQYALFLSWFQSIGFNRYNNRSFDNIVHLTTHDDEDTIEISRTTYVETAFDAPVRDVRHILPLKRDKKLINITLQSTYIPIGLQISNNCAPSQCGMLFWDRARCFCFVYISPYQLSKSYGMTTLLDLMKFPSRILKFAQMRYTTASLKDASFSCLADAPSCVFHAPTFTKSARLIKWSWFAEKS